jgi:hypothetical protein
MLDLDDIRDEIDRMRIQVGRQRKEIFLLQRAGISTASAELLLGQMLAKIDTFCEQRDELKKDLPKPHKVLGGRSWRGIYPTSLTFLHSCTPLAMSGIKPPGKVTAISTSRRSSWR